MKTLFSRSIVISIVAVSAAIGVIAQSAPPVDSARMFAGETLKYEGKMDKILHGISVADLSFNAIIPPNSNELLIRSEAVSKGTLLKLFRYSFLQQYDSTVRTNTVIGPGGDAAGLLASLIRNLPKQPPWLLALVRDKAWFKGEK